MAGKRDLGVATPLDTIKGWNDKRKSNNQIISSLTPFVQLIGIFDESMYEKMFSTLNERVPVTFDTGDSSTSTAYNEKYNITKLAGSYDSVRAKMKERFINLYLVENVEHGLNVDPVEGIVMAESVSQAKEPAGGIGITDLQVDYGSGGRAAMGARQFNLRMTINDLKLLDTKFEYSQLAANGADFLIIYGWANPDVVPGYDAAMSPPKLELDPNDTSATDRKRLIVPLRNLGNGGYWSAGRVSINSYNFSFNELGKLEVNLTLMDSQTRAMSIALMSNMSKKVKYFLQGDIFGKLITDAQGNEFTLKDSLKARQKKLNDEYHQSRSDDKIPDMTEAMYTAQREALLDFTESVQIAVNNNGKEEVISDIPRDDLGFNQDPTAEESKKTQNEMNQAVKGYPDETAIVSYKEKYVTVIDTDPDINSRGETSASDEDEKDADDTGVASSSLPTKQIISYEKQPVYYFLGAIMDSVSLSMGSAKTGFGGPKSPAFYYAPMNEDSKLSTTFASNMQSVTRKSSYEERIQEAVIRLKERFLPPAPRSMAPPFMRGGNQVAERETQEYMEGLNAAFSELGINFSVGTVIAKRIAAAAALNKKNYTSSVGGTSVVYEGVQTIEKNRVVNALYPAPPNVARMIGAPMRGTRKMVNTGSGGNRELLEVKGLSPVGNLMCFIPDWKKEVSLDSDGNEVESFSGAPDGFDPLDPTDYKAKDKGTLFYMVRTYDANKVAQSMEGGAAAGSVAGIIGTIAEKKKATAGGVVKVNHIVTYDDWRLTDLNTWNLLQRKWHNLYREYLGSYFEDLIRKRVAEIEEYGIPIEAIYNEVLDLDWLTGKIYNNASWLNGRRYHNGKHWLKGADEVYGGPAGSFNIADAETKLNREVKKYRDVIAESNLTLEGASQTDPIAVERGLKPAGLSSSINELTSEINTLKEQVEELTGGIYDRSQDIAGNTIMVRFKNFVRVEASNDWTWHENSPEAAATEYLEREAEEVNKRIIEEVAIDENGEVDEELLALLADREWEEDTIDDSFLAGYGDE